ncbi:MAG: asparaginase, partial [Mesorhizobium sp.]
MAEPFFVAGTGREDVALMEAAPGRIFTKGGAEGVHCAAIPELGLGIALKCDDGAGRAGEAMIATVLAKLL